MIIFRFIKDQSKNFISRKITKELLEDFLDWLESFLCGQRAFRTVKGF